MRPHNKTRRVALKTGVALLASGAPAIAQSSGGGARTLQDRADELLRNAVESGDIPGVVAMATNRDGVTYQGAFGQRVRRGDSSTSSCGKLPGQARSSYCCFAWRANQTVISFCPRLSQLW